MIKPTRPSHFFLALAFILGCIALYPGINIHGAMATGDHGRDLYAFERTLHGDIPYQDYWWVYGPLMPYYYALFDHFLGINVQSILIGKLLLTLASGMLIYFTIETLAGGLTAFAGAAWFFAFGRDFFFTYNHAGGIACITFIMLCMAQYIRRRNAAWLWTGLVGAFILSLVKLNFGLAALPALLLTAWLTDRLRRVPFTAQKLKFYLFTLTLLPLIISGVYFSFLRGLSWAEIQQCMPFGRNDGVYETNTFAALGLYFSIFWQNTLTHLTDFILCVLVLSALFRILFTLSGPCLRPNTRKESLLILILFGTCFILNFHEYLKGGLWYRTFWVQPAGIVWMFTVIHLALRKYPGIFRVPVFILLIVLSAIHVNKVCGQYRQIQAAGHYLPLPRGGVFLANDQDWFKTVEETSLYLKQNLGAGETFFTLPYDALYYYLAGQKAPTRMLIFFDHMHIPPEQEQNILQELESAKVNFVVLSNRIRSPEMGLGIFGKTYCPVIAKYIDDNFVPAVQFGDWQNEPGWAWNYGTLIFKRKVSLK